MQCIACKANVILAKDKRKQRGINQRSLGHRRKEGIQEGRKKAVDVDLLRQE